MMGLSLPHLIVLALVVLLLFGRGKISDLMGDFGKGIKSFKEGIADETTNRPVTPPPAQLAAPVAGQPVSQPYAQPVVGTVATPHPEMVPHGQPPVQAAAHVATPTLNGEPLPELTADQQTR